MNIRLPRFGFPLLGKELTELAVRRRTYVVRVLYAVLLFTIFGFFMHEMTRRFGQNQGMQLNLMAMGLGRQIFEFVVYAQFVGIYLFLPVMMAGVITSEKERDSLSLLLLTDLRPREILLEKYLSRLIPMFSFLLLSMPLMAIAYSLGGIGTGYLWSGIWLLFWTCLQVGAIALMCSAFCRTTPSAIISSYIVGGIFYCSILIVGAGLALIDYYVAGRAISAFFNHHEPILRKAVAFLGMNRMRDEDVLCLFFAPYIFDATKSSGFMTVVLRSIPSMASTLLFLGLARMFLLRRAFVPARHWIRRFFKWLDRVFARLNRLVGGITLRRVQEDLPADQPVAWRELSRRSLGQPQHLFRILVGIMVPLVILLAWGSLASLSSGYLGWHEEWLSVILFILWPLAVLVVATMGVNAVASERANQTLNVLLTTTVTGREIVRQKMRSVSRMIWVMMVPLLVVVVCEAFLEVRSDSRGFWWAEYRDPIVVDLVASVSTILIYLPMVAWLGMMIGLRVKSRTRALLTVLGVIIGWTAGWPFLLLLIDEFNIVIRHVQEGWYIVSPAVMVILSEFADVDELDMGRWLVILVNSVIFGGCWIVFRWVSLRRADRWLGRGK
jgi:ABC-type transport system involved in multi-copper enzyme maturation permease subunit